MPPTSLSRGQDVGESSLATALDTVPQWKAATVLGRDNDSGDYSVQFQGGKKDHSVTDNDIRSAMISKPVQVLKGGRWTPASIVVRAATTGDYTLRYDPDGTVASSVRPADVRRAPTNFKTGQDVEVCNKELGKWVPASVVARDWEASPYEVCHTSDNTKALVAPSSIRCSNAQAAGKHQAKEGDDIEVKLGADAAWEPATLVRTQPEKAPNVVRFSNSEVNAEVPVDCIRRASDQPSSQVGSNEEESPVLIQRGGERVPGEVIGTADQVEGSGEGSAIGGE